jgi:hypothetical protein
MIDNVGTAIKLDPIKLIDSFMGAADIFRACSIS